MGASVASTSGITQRAGCAPTRVCLGWHRHGCRGDESSDLNLVNNATHPRPRSKATVALSWACWLKYSGVCYHACTGHDVASTSGITQRRWRAPTRTCLGWHHHGRRDDESLDSNLENGLTHPRKRSDESVASFWGMSVKAWCGIYLWRLPEAWASPYERHASDVTFVEFLAS